MSTNEQNEHASLAELHRSIATGETSAHVKRVKKVLGAVAMKRQKRGVMTKKPDMIRSELI